MGNKSKSLSSLGELLRAEGFEPSSDPTPTPEPAQAPAIRFAAKIVLRRERKGRGGKTVTTVSGVAGDVTALTDLLRDLKRRLGCGGRLDGEQLVFQGDCRDELAALLRERGAGQIRIS